MAQDNSSLLFLKGHSVRVSYGSVKTYVGVFYLSDNSLNEISIFERNNINRVLLFHILSDRVTPRRFEKFINNGLSLNIPDDEFNDMLPRVKKLSKLLGNKFQNGTTVKFEWIPEKQVSVVMIDDVIKGEIPGYDFNNAILKLWIGSQPVSRSFKESILGLNQ